MLWAIMDEGALRRPVGEQASCGATRHVLGVAQSQGQSTGGAGLGRRACGVSGAFVIAEFREGPDVAYLDTAAQGQIADHPDIVKACAQVFDTLRAEALPPRASLDLIAEVRDTWT